MALIYHTLARHIHQTLRARFVAGEYLPGSRLYEDRLADEFDVSLTPVREAVKLLESDGLVVRKAHRALYARSFTMREAREVYEVRELLEPHAAALASASADREWMESMDALVRRQQDALHAARFGEVQTLTAQFHIRIAEQANNHLLTSMIERVWLMVPILRTLAWRESGYARPSHVVDEHRAMLDGIMRGPDQAERLAREHVRKSWDGVREALDRVLEDVARI